MEGILQEEIPQAARTALLFFQANQAETRQASTICKSGKTQKYKIVLSFQMAYFSPEENSSVCSKDQRLFHLNQINFRNLE